MRIYLAHPVSDYGSQRQAETIALITARGWTVENPDQLHHARLYRERGMDHFLEVVEGCDGLVFLRFPDGTIGAGVGKEIEAALRRGLMVWDASDGQLKNAGTMMPFPVLSVEDTRQALDRFFVRTPAPQPSEPGLSPLSPFKAKEE